VRLHEIKHEHPASGGLRFGSEPGAGFAATVGAGGGLGRGENATAERGSGGNGGSEEYVDSW